MKKGNDIMIDLTNLNHNLKPKDREVVDAFFDVLDCHSKPSTEMITTWVGHNPEGGGKILMDWNSLQGLVWVLLNDLRIAKKDKKVNE